MDASHHVVGNLIVLLVTPPEKNIGPVENILGKAVLRLIERRGRNGSNPCFRKPSASTA
jgi:hypothetical protein